MAPERLTARTPAKSLAPSREWEALTPPLADWILEAVSDMGYKRMTPVQASTIPEFMRNRDVVVEAVTGSGKTLAYLIPTVERLLRLEEPLKRHHVGAIIISPTRELAAQIYGVLQKLLAFHGPSAERLNPSLEEKDEEEAGDKQASIQIVPASTLKVVPQLLLGGNTSTAEDLSHFLKYSPNLLISTPGRLLELLSSPHVHCPQFAFEVLILDEADRLLDLGFKDDLQKILGRLPKQRRTGLFSASVSEAVDQLVRVGLRNSKKITVKVKNINGGEDKRTPSSLQLSYLESQASHKLPMVSKLLSALTPVPSKCIIFLSTCAAVEYFQHVLPSILPSRDGQSFLLVSLHGKQLSKIRDKNFTRFSNSASPAILLTTDVAARGLDIPQVDLVVQIDPPSDAKVFLHRCGRAGRAGRKGLSVVLLQPGREAQEYPGFLERRGTPVAPLSTPSIVASDEDATNAAASMRKVVLTDRAIHDKAQRAFPSWVKSYSKHQASHIFRINELDWDDLGRAWGLLKLPKMPELKKWEGDKSLGLEVDFKTYAYRDKQREHLRQQTLKKRDEIPEGKISVFNNDKKRAWSDKLDQRDEREKRRDKKRIRREREKWEQMTPAERAEQKKLEDMIEQVKRRRLQDDLEEFNGFDD